MGKDYSLFNFQDIIADLKKKHDGDKEYEDYNKFIEGVNEDATLEELPFFQDYLSRFDIEKAFEGFSLAAEEDSLATKDDLFLLFRLIIASFSSTYEILYDKPSNSIDLSITVTLGERTLTRSIAELFSFQVEKLYENYIDEQINLYTCFIDPDYTQEIDVERKKRLMIFEKKVRQLKDLQESDGILSDLDALLNS
jgi:hypothetical protein